MNPLPLHYTALMVVLRANGIATHQVTILSWYEDDNGKRYNYCRSPDNVRVYAVAILQDRLRARAVEALQAQGYVLIPQPPHNGRHPTYAVLAE